MGDHPWGLRGTKLEKTGRKLRISARSRAGFGNRHKLKPLNCKQTFIWPTRSTARPKTPSPSLLRIKRSPLRRLLGFCCRLSPFAAPSVSAQLQAATSKEGATMVASKKTVISLPLSEPFLVAFALRSSRFLLDVRRSFDGTDVFAPFFALQKKTHESINNRLALVMKSGKYTLGYKTVLKTLRNSKGGFPFARFSLVASCPVSSIAVEKRYD